MAGFQKPDSGIKYGASKLNWLVALLCFAVFINRRLVRWKYTA